MKPAPFTYARPDTVDEALELLAQNGSDARILAGGQSLVAMLNLRLVRPKVIIDIGRLTDLQYIKVKDGALEVGAGVTQAMLEVWPALMESAPFVAEVLPWVGHFQTRNRGTVCGSIAHNDPSSELPLALALLDGEVILKSKSGERRLNASAFQTGLLQTARNDHELLTAVRFPKALPDAGIAFREVARRHGDFAIVSVGAIAHSDGQIKLGVGGIAECPHVETLKVDALANDFGDEIQQLAWRLGGYSDIHASARYRRDLLRRLTPLVIAQAREGAMNVPRSR
ncbi:MAG: FAD binding domain-containing protein [Hyphomicrobiaceae bacterium]